MIQYDPGVIQRFADKLYAQADRIVAFYTILFALLGGVGGAAASPRRVNGGYVVLGVVLVGAIGLVIGQARAFILRLQAQVALCQVQIERNTRGAGPGPATA